MALKQLAHKAPAPLPDAPTWGTLAAEGEPASVLRLESVDLTESLAYHTLTRWALRAGAEETLTIYAGGVTVTVHGRELGPVRDALDAGRLISIRAAEGRYLQLRSGTAVTNIVVSSKGMP